MPDSKRSRRVDAPSIFCFHPTRKTRWEICSHSWCFFVKSHQNPSIWQDIQWFWSKMCSFAGFGMLFWSRNFRKVEFSKTAVAYICWESSRGTTTMVYPIVIMFVYVIKLDKKIRLIFKTIFRARSCVALISSSSKAQNTAILIKFIKITVFSC